MDRSRGPETPIIKSGRRIFQFQSLIIARLSGSVKSSLKQNRTFLRTGGGTAPRRRTPPLREDTAGPQTIPGVICDGHRPMRDGPRPGRSGKASRETTQICREDRRQENKLRACSCKTEDTKLRTCSSLGGWFFSSWHSVCKRRN